jgi:hypothetical protein
MIVFLKNKTKKMYYSIIITILIIIGVLLFSRVQKQKRVFSDSLVQ